MEQSIGRTGELHIARYFEYVWNVEENASDYQNAENTSRNEHRKVQANVVEEIDNKDVSPVAYVCATTAYPLEKPKFPNLAISNAEVDSDDEDVYLSFEERAENYYQRL